MPHPLHGLIQALDDRRCALFDELDTLSGEVLSAKPHPDTWSILEVVEHLVLAERVILQGLPERTDLVARPRSLKNHGAYALVWLILRWGIPVKVPSRRMLPTGNLSLVELRQAWDEHVRWLRSFEEGSGVDAYRQAVFLHPVAGPITLVQALRLDQLHLRIHTRQISKLRKQYATPNA